MFNTRPARLLLLLTLAAILGARVAGPSALQRFDQPKTVSYTGDIVANGCWLLPRDMLGRPATKPPLVNWLAAPVVAMGFWKEWAVKWPMVAGSLATLAMCVMMARRLFEKNDAATPDPNFAVDVAAVAGIAWLTNPAVTVAIYHCRPDPLLVAFLTAAWILGTETVDPAKPQKFSTTLLFWLCVGFAALTKGPAALLPVIYLPLAARLIFGSWKHVARAQWWWGAPLAIAIFAAWIVPVALIYPEHFKTVLLQQELIAPVLGLGRHYGKAGVTNAGPIALLTGIFDNPQWFLSRFAPWSLATIGALIAIGPRRWFHHAMAPAILWLLLTIAFFSLSANKTHEHIMPAYPAAAILAAFFCATALQRFHVRPVHVAVAGLLLVPGFIAQTLFLSDAAKSRSGEELKNFARAVEDKIDNQPVAFIDTGYNTLQFFLHRHQPGEPDKAALDSVRWIITAQRPEWPHDLTLVTSGKISRDQDKILTLGLYPRESVESTLRAKPELR
jgi:4-amino-4-deoxy-L-arabinose transferase-like glycosyltransferase